MFGSTVLDVVIGLILVYLILSVAVSTFNEMAEGLLKRRSKYLSATLHRIAGSDLADQLYKTTWVQSLSGYSHSLRTQRLRHLQPFGKNLFGKKHPPYIPSDVFVQAMREILHNLTTQTMSALDELKATGELDKTIAMLPAAVRNFLPARQLDAAELFIEIERCRGQAIDNIIDQLPSDVLDDLDGEALKLRQWFEHSMDRMSGWYSRQTKWLLFFWGFIIALALNVDTFAIASTLWTDDVTRATAISAAEAATQGEGGDCHADADDPYSCVDQAVQKIKTIDGIGMPIGWPDWPWNWDDPVTDKNRATSETAVVGERVGDDSRIPQDFDAWLLRILGITATAGAITTGAPFWFDLLNRFVNIRASGPKPERTTSRSTAGVSNSTPQTPDYPSNGFYR